MLVPLGHMGLLGIHTQKHKKNAKGKLGIVLLRLASMSSSLCSQCLYMCLLEKHLMLTGVANTGVYLYLFGKHS